MKKLAVLLTLVAAALLSASPSFAEDPPPFILKWGSQGSGNGQFNQPGDVAVDSRSDVYVADYVNHRIQKFTNDGGFLSAWGSYGNGDGQFQFPWGVAVDDNDNIYVAERVGHRVQKFTKDGVFIMKWGSQGSADGQFEEPIAIAIDQSGYVYVGDFNNRIQKFTNDGTFVMKWGTYGSGDGQLYGPTGIAIDSGGNLYIADSGNDRIQKFTNDGTFVMKWGTYGTGDGQFDNPRDLTCDTAGDIYVSDMSNCRIQKFTNDGTFVMKWGSSGTGDGLFSAPLGIALDHNDYVFVADCNNHRIQKFGPGGPSGPGGLPAVVLVHGYCSDADAWSDLEPRLQQQGFQTYSISLTPNDSRPQELVGTLELFLRTHFPASQKVNVIAHSMGGLVAREYIARQADNCMMNKISTLITLGTPHHGSDLATLGERDPSMKYVLRPLLKKLWVCPAEGPAYQDLVTGSAFLNGLNYGAAHEKYDTWASTSKGTHAAEDLRDQAVQYVTVAGTEGMCGPALTNTVDAWSTSIAARLLNTVDYENDGVVGVDAARLYASGISNYVDDDLATGDLVHLGGAATIPLYCTLGTPFLQSELLARILGNILKGGSPVPASQAMQLVVTATEEASSDTVFMSMPSPRGTLGTGQVTEVPFTVPSTTLFRVLMSSTDAKLFLSSPLDTLITPADTLTTPGLHYFNDVSLGLEGYLYENPPAGSWAVRIDGSASSQAQEYATAISIASTNAIAISTTPSFVYEGESVVVQASIKNVGVPIPDVSWDVTVVRPDSTSFLLALYDDGAHGDSLADDGIFGAVLNPITPIGFYHFEAKGTMPAGGPTLVAGTTFELATFRDLGVDSTLVFSKNLIASGDSVLVTATVRNLGADPVSNVKVEFWDNSAKFCVDSLDLSGNGTDVISCQWIAASPDSHTIRVTVDPFTLPFEVSYANNSTTKLVVLGVLVGVGEEQGMRQLWLAPAQPNPSTGDVMFRITAPVASEATLELFDLAGRRIRSWRWNELPAGVRVITWDRRTHDGSTAATGIYFARLSANGRSLTTKVVLLR